MIAILHYGLGNIKAFANIYHEANIPYRIVESVADLDGASKIILPGVGSFDHAVREFRDSGMAERVAQLVMNDRIPILGVCVGMQMLARSSEEGSESGLGWVPGVVRKIRFTDTNTRNLLPHMGWNAIDPDESEPLLQGLDAASGFYFLHSYRFECDSEANAIAYADYGGRFACAVREKNVYGVQCHPEKSHQNGVRLLKNFAEL